MNKIEEVMVALESGQVCFCKHTEKYFYVYKGFLGNEMLAVSNSREIPKKNHKDRGSVCNMWFYKHELLSEWEILERREELKCLFCNNKVMVVSYSHWKSAPERYEGCYTLKCKNNSCNYSSPYSEHIDSAIKIHEDLYRKLGR